jgi:hypothetical protein
MEEQQKHTNTPEAQPAPPEQKNLLTTIKKNKITWIVAGVVLVALIAGAIFMLTQNQNKQSNDTQNNTNTQTANNNESSFLQQYKNTCKERDVTFSSAPMKKEDLAYIRPLGAVSDGHVTPTDHVYIGGPNPQAADNTYPVLMPADGTVVEVSAMPAQYVGDRAGQQVAQEDHRMVISHSCRYFSIYIHIHKLSDKVKEAFGALKPNESKQANLELKAGDTVGYIGGSTFDWTPVDTSVTLKGFITPSLYKGESWKVHTVSPFDLYQGSLKAELEAKSLRSVAPLGGKIDYDQAGKLIGNWFREGSGGYSGNNNDNGGRYWDGHLSVAPDYIDPASTIVSIGNWTGDAKQFVVSGSVDPSKTGEQDGMVKYELKRLSHAGADGQMWNGSSLTKGVRPSQSSAVEGTIALQVLAGNKLKVEKFPGKTAAQVTGFTSAAQTYER